jgi:hypothetical protein
MPIPHTPTRIAEKQVSGEGIATLKRWVGDADVLYLRQDRSDTLVVVPERTWLRLLAGVLADGKTHALAAEQLPEDPRHSGYDHSPLARAL